MVLKWLRLNLNYTFISFDSDNAVREDYEENKIFFSVSVIPAKPIRPDMTSSRKSLEADIFSR